MATKKSNKTSSFGDRFVKFFTTMIAVCAVIAVCFIGYAIYYFNNNPPQTVTTNYVDALAFAEEKTFFTEVNVMTNKNKNGVEIAELKFNYYTDIHLPVEVDHFKNIYSSGIQWKSYPQFSESDTVVWWGQVKKYAPKNAFLYNYTDGVGYKAVNELSPDDKWIVDFSTDTVNEDLTDYEQNLARLEQRGVTHIEGGFLNWGFSVDHNIFSLTKSVLDASYTLPNGTHVLQFDLSPFFTPYIYNQETQQFDIASKTGDMYTFVNILVHRSDNGLVQASQSIFNLVGNNPSYDIDGVNKTTYWRDATHYTLTEEDFVFLETDGEYEKIGKLKQSAIDYLSTFGGTYIEVDIDLDSAWLANRETIFIGLASDAFGGLRVNKISTHSESPSTFWLGGYTGLVVTSDTITVVGGGV